jgi:glycerate-2-kinase
MNCPVAGITLQEEIAATDVLLKSGAGIFEINAIRRHISQMNGGMLARRIQAVGAEFIGVGISDGIGVAPTGDIAEPCRTYASTPIGPDRTTLDDARQVIRDYDLARRLPPSVVAYLTHAGPAQETPKAFPDNTYFLLNAVPDSCLAARKVAEAMGIPALVLTSFLEGESRDAGTFFAAIARQVQAFGSPIQPPCIILSCGETTTQIADNSLITGHGGPSQELTAGFALAAGKASGACMLSIDSEGTDGTTPVAGGITDSQTRAAAVRQGIDLHAALRGHATFEALEPLGDVVLTGNTGTNLCDFNVLYIPPADQGRP